MPVSSMSLADDLFPTPEQVKVLTLDIETSPALAHVWQLRDVNVSLNQLLEPSRVLCVGVKWLHRKRVNVIEMFDPDTADFGLAQVWSMVDDADIVIGYNHKSFDMKHLQREWLVAGMGQPSPVQHIDLLPAVRKHFAFPSRKLDYVSRALGIGQKVAHEGHGLWVACLNGDLAAQRRMVRYCRGDVRLTEDLYLRLRSQGWLGGGPSIAAITARDDICPTCGHRELRDAGWHTTGTLNYPRYQCPACWTYCRGARSVGRTNVRSLP